MPSRSLRVSLGLLLNRAGLMMLVVATVTMAGWGVLAILSTHALNTLSTTLVYEAVGQQAGGLIYLGAALLAGWGILHPGTHGFTLGLLQNALLLMAAGRAIVAVIGQHYAGGTTALGAPAAFIATDQLLVVTAALGHLVSLFIYHGHLEALHRQMNGQGGDGN